MAILIPFTGGVESTYLAQKALDAGDSVSLGYFGVTQSVTARLSEIVARRHMIDFFSRKYSQPIGECYGFFEHMCFVPKTNRLDKSCLRQQWNLINNLIAATTVYNNDQLIIDAVWIGWAKYDTAEHSLTNIDFNVDEYQRFLDSYAEGLFLSSADKSMKRPFLPLWEEESKKAVYDKLYPELQACIVGNGVGSYVPGEELVEHRIYDVKNTEYHKAGVPVHAHFPMVELNPMEQAMIDFQQPGYINIPLKYHGYRTWLKDFDPKFHKFLSAGITRIITGNTDKVFVLSDLAGITTQIMDYLQDFKTLVGAEVPTQALPA